MDWELYQSLKAKKTTSLVPSIYIKIYWGAI